MHWALVFLLYCFYGTVFKDSQLNKPMMSRNISFEQCNLIHQLNLIVDWPIASDLRSTVIQKTNILVKVCR